jgi:hypothetical protein
MGKFIPAGISSTDNSCCSVPLVGITCDSKNKVTAINWRMAELSGSIPPEIGNLNSLQNLALDINSLSGSIPAEIGNLKKLTDM